MVTEKSLAAFIMPYYFNGKPESIPHLELSVDSIINQTDENWNLILVNNGVKDESVLKKYREIVAKDSRIISLDNDENIGASRAYNQAIGYAKKQLHAEFLLFLDCDDTSCCQRLGTVRRRFIENPDVGVVFHAFDMIDQFDNPLQDKDIPWAHKEIIAVNPSFSFKSYDLWIDMALNDGYMNLTSATSVLTDVAYRIPFPEYMMSEDYYAWMNYSASGAGFLYHAEALSSYRVFTGGSQNTREAMGGDEEYFKTKVKVDSISLEDALYRYMTRKNAEHDRRDILGFFHLRLAETLLKEGMDKLALAEAKKYFKLRKRNLISSERIRLDN